MICVNTSAPEAKEKKNLEKNRKEKEEIKFEISTSNCILS
jgi:hypothetical protein